MFDESLEVLQVTSGSLLPPFKTVRVQNEPLLDGFAIKSANKTYTQSQTIVVTKELQLNAQVGTAAENGPLKDRIREIISQKNIDEHDQPAPEQFLAEHRPLQKVPSSSELRAFEMLAAPFAGHSPEKKQEFLSFTEISKLEPRESQANR